MEEIGKNIYLEESYAGVALGALKLDRGFLFVDSPIRHSEQASWRERAAQFGNPFDRITLMLDAHIDRTIGLQALGGDILGHENAVEILSSRPAVLRPQDIEAGSVAEILAPPVNVRWVHPNMTFTHNLDLHTSENAIAITHRPGAHLAGCWVCLEAEKIIFVGDSVLAHQPPFLAWADLKTWQDELAELQAEPLKDYKIISSRNGLVNQKMIIRLADFILDINNLLPELEAQEERKEAIADVLSGLLRKLNINKKHAELYRKRLAHGLSGYLKRHETLIKKEE
jgi:glyoxylase-like metal-dependent hydrolase (beta-lactamase superfamily II)